jgi:RNA recognition motif-containing protein
MESKNEEFSKSSPSSKKTSSPQNGRSPREKSISPRRRNSPSRSRSPRRSPRGKSPSPRRRSYSPRRRSYSPRGRSYSPRGRSPPRYNPRRFGNERDRAETTCLYIGNLPRHFRERDVEDLFRKEGKIRNIRVGANKVGSVYAFVNFEDRRDAEDVFDKYYDFSIEGHKIKIDWDVGLEKKRRALPPRRYSPRRRSRSPRRRYSPDYSPGRRSRSPYDDKRRRY